MRRCVTPGFSRSKTEAAQADDALQPLRSRGFVVLPAFVGFEPFTDVWVAARARLARTPATMRPEAFDVSIPSRNDRKTMSRSRSSRIVVMTSAALRPRRSIPTTTMASAWSGVVEQ